MRILHPEMYLERKSSDQPLIKATFDLKRLRKMGVLLLLLFSFSYSSYAQLSLDMGYIAEELGVRKLIGYDAFEEPVVLNKRLGELKDSLKSISNHQLDDELNLIEAVTMNQLGEKEESLKILSDLIQRYDKNTFMYRSASMLTAALSADQESSAQNQLFALLDCARETDNKQLEFDACIMISRFYISNLERRDLSWEWVDRAAELLPEVDNLYNCNVYYLVAADATNPNGPGQEDVQIENPEEKRQEAIDLVNKSIACGEEILLDPAPFANELSLAYHIRGDLSKTKEEEIVYMKKSLEILRKQGRETYEILWKYLRLSEANSRIGNWKESYAYLDSTRIELQDSFPGKRDVEQFYYEMVVVYYELTGNQPDSLAKYLRLKYEMREAQARRQELAKVEENTAKFKDAEQKLEIEQHETEIAKTEKRTQSLVIILISLFIVAILAAIFYVRIRSRKKEIETMVVELETNVKEKTALIQEVNHRVKNNLQMITAFVDMQARSEGAETKNFSESIRKRIRAVSLVHEMIVEEDRLSGMPLEEYVRELAEELESLYQEDGLLQCHIDFDPVVFDLSTTMYLGVLLNELLSNSMKHAGKEGEDLNIWMTLRKHENDFTLSYKDSGDGIPDEIQEKKRASKSIGLSLIRSMVAQLEGTLTYTKDVGSHYTLEFPFPDDFNQD